MARTGPAIHRIKKRPEFLSVARHGHKVVASTLVLQGYHAGNALPCRASGIRVGFTVTKKTGNAVIRNRIRRRLRAAADAILPEVGRDGWDYVVIGRARAREESFDIILRDLRYAVRKTAKLEAAAQEGEGA